MNVLLVSQCDKRALTSTRRIVDQFAVRHGSRTWQTPVTTAGLDTLHRMLRSQARKNTAVACHRIRRDGGTELLWIVGDRRRFGPSGEVPTDTTSLDVLRRQDEDAWRHGALMRWLAELAGLLHDLGKAIAAFQRKLKDGRAPPNLIRHEWVSLRLWQSFVGSDDDAGWLARMAGNDLSMPAWTSRLVRDLPGTPPRSPFSTMKSAPLARAIGWLVVTHHRLPVPPSSEAAIGMTAPLDHELNAAWNEPAINAGAHSDGRDSSDDRNDPSSYWQFDDGLPSEHTEWRRRAARIARHLIGWSAAGGAKDGPPLANPHLMHLARLGLMLADHHYSTLEGDPANPASGRVLVDDCGPLVANTKSDAQGRRIDNQPLVEHLVGVGRGAAEIIAFLPGFERHLPSLLHAARLRRRESDPRFRWQNAATDLAASLRAKASERGAFVINLASTGCGKTLANAKVMNALADPARGLRCAFAIGLRTLTLQTGRQFREFLGLSEDQIAVRVGGAESRELFEAAERDAAATGSASAMPLIDDEAVVEYDGDVSHHPLLRRAVADDRIRRLLVAPLLVCTVDHLVPATEGLRGGRQIAPMLRLMSGDLVLDEVDDYDLDDLPALVRLTHWAGMLGAKVLLSSATLAPALVEALFGAYLEGRRQFERNVASPSPRSRSSVCCVWVDEDDRSTRDCAASEEFSAAHATFVDARIRRLDKRSVESPRRRLQMVEMLRPRGTSGERSAFFTDLAKSLVFHAVKLHETHHTVHPVTGRKISFGLVRMANVHALVDAARAMFVLGRGGLKGYRLHVCVYHASHPLLMRSAIEMRLDAVLDRRGDEDGARVFMRSEVAGPIAAHPQDDHIFIVLGSPVTEVGRDHCYDWAVVEPSSMRSLIQLAGRVMRHRARVCTTPNIRMFSTNVRHHLGRDAAAYRHPGFEEPAGRFHLTDQDLSHDAVLSPAQSSTPDARPRLAERQVAPSEPIVNWVDLEHARLRAALLDDSCLSAQWWRKTPEAVTTTGVLQAATKFRKDNQSEVELVLRPDAEGLADDDVSNVCAWRVGVMRDGSDGIRPGRAASRRMREILVPLESGKCTFEDLLVAGRITPWIVGDYLSELRRLAEQRGLTIDACALRYGRTRLKVWRDDGQTAWIYNEVLGFYEKR